MDWFRQVNWQWAIWRKTWMCWVRNGLYLRKWVEVKVRVVQVAQLDSLFRATNRGLRNMHTASIRNFNCWKFKHAFRLESFVDIVFANFRLHTYPPFSHWSRPGSQHKGSTSLIDDFLFEKLLLLPRIPHIPSWKLLPHLNTKLTSTICLYTHYTCSGPCVRIVNYR